MIIQIHPEGQTDLLEIRHTSDALGTLLGPSQGGQKQRSKDSNDGNDYQKLDQGKPKDAPVSVRIGRR